MEIHESSGSLAVQVAAEIRAEFARQGRKFGDYVPVAGMSRWTLQTRLSGRKPFDLNELTSVCAWLGVDASEIVARAYAAVA